MKSDKKKNDYFEIIENNFGLKLIICFVLCSIIIMAFLSINRAIDRKKFQVYTIVDDIKLMNSIENISTDNNKFNLSGYAFILDRNANNSNISVFLLNVETKEEIWLNTITSKRADVNSYFKCEYDYENSGFIASSNAKKLKKDQIYEIIINIDYIDQLNNNYSNKNRMTVSSNKYILNNELYAYNPNEFDIPDMNVKSEMLKEVFSKGKLCYYFKDAGMYVYQYNDKLYWITNENFEFQEKGETFIPYHVFTTQVNRLPEERIQYKYDYFDFFFEKYENSDDFNSPYRVAIRDIPKDYAITYIRTGVYNLSDKNWIYEKMFHLDNYLIQ